MSKIKEANIKVSDKTLAQHLQVYESEASPSGETLPESHKLYRIIYSHGIFEVRNTTTKG